MSSGPVQRLLYSARAPREWLRLARNLGAFYRGRPPKAPPLAVAWDLTYRCDCRCPFCNTHELNRRVRALPRDGALRIARRLADARVPWVTLSGGEPLLVGWEARRPKDGFPFPTEVYLRRIEMWGESVILACIRSTAK